VCEGPALFARRIAYGSGVYEGSQAVSRDARPGRNLAARGGGYWGAKEASLLGVWLLAVWLPLGRGARASWTNLATPDGERARGDARAELGRHLVLRAVGQCELDVRTSRVRHMTLRCITEQYTYLTCAPRAFHSIASHDRALHSTCAPRGGFATAAPPSVRDPSVLESTGGDGQRGRSRGGGRRRPARRPATTREATGCATGRRGGGRTLSSHGAGAAAGGRTRLRAPRRRARRACYRRRSRLGAASQATGNTRDGRQHTRENDRPTE
jgi:hypothetical protein